MNQSIDAAPESWLPHPRYFQFLNKIKQRKIGEKKNVIGNVKRNCKQKEKANYQSPYQRFDE